VRFVARKTEVRVPSEVRLRGRHAPSRADETVNYLELAGTADAEGHERLEPFRVRAKTAHEFDEWIRTFSYCVKSLGGAGTIVVVKFDEDELSEDDEARESSATVVPDDDDEDHPDAETKCVDRAELGTTVPPATEEDFDEVDDDERTAAVPASSETTPATEPLNKKTAAALVQADVVDAAYYYQDGDAAVGPVGVGELRDRWKQGTLEPGSYVYPSVLEDWVTIDAVPPLLRLLSPPKPPSARSGSSSRWKPPVAPAPQFTA